MPSIDVVVKVAPLENDPSGLCTLARVHQLTSYNAAYLALALHTGLPLYTKDKNLKAAARRAEVHLVMD